VVVRVNDRGPFHSNRIMDLSYAAAWKLGLIAPGSGQVVVERILPSEIRYLASNPAPAQAASAVEPQPVPIPEVLSSTELPPPPGARAARDAPPRSTLAAGIYLQLGAFSQQANAQSLASRLNQQLGGGPASVMIERTDQLYRVRLGPYADRDAALAAVPDVNARTGILPSLAK
jgi:rare lipoprotein A